MPAYSRHAKFDPYFAQSSKRMRVPAQVSRQSLRSNLENPYHFGHHKAHLGKGLSE